MVRVFEHAFLCGWAHVWVRKFAWYSSPYVLKATARFSTGMAAT